MAGRIEVGEGAYLMLDNGPGLSIIGYSTCIVYLTSYILCRTLRGTSIFNAQLPLSPDSARSASKNTSLKLHYFQPFSLNLD